MTDDEYEELREKERRLEQKKDNEAFDRLSKSARSVSVWSALFVALFIIVAVVVFFNKRQSFVTAIVLFLSGCIIGVVGEAVSSSMEAFAEHMKDTKEVRKDMDRLMEKVEKRNNP